MIYIGVDPGKNGGIAVIGYENKQEQNKRKSRQAFIQKI